MDIQARIEQLKAQIAEKEAYQKKLQESYSNPYKKHSYANMWDYVVEGNRAGYDKEDAEAAAYQKLLMEQAQADKIRAEQAYNTAYENELNIVNARDIASRTNSGYGSTDETAKLMREIEFAQAEYEMAKDNLDVADPKSVADYKKATSKYNYWIKQLPKEFEGYEPYSMEVIEDSPRVKINKAKKWLDAHKGNEKLTDAEQAEFDSKLALLSPEEQEAYKVVKAKKGPTVETAEKNELKELIKFEKANLLDSKQRTRLNNLRKKYPGVK